MKKHKKPKCEKSSKKHPKEHIKKDCREDYDEIDITCLKLDNSLTFKQKEKLIKKVLAEFITKTFKIWKLKYGSNGANNMELTITNKQKVNVQIDPQFTSGPNIGQPVFLNGAPTWEVTSGNSTVVTASDGKSSDLVSSDTAGDTVYTVTVNADFGAGEGPVSDTITLHVTDDGVPTTGEGILRFTASAPVDK